MPLGVAISKQKVFPSFEYAIFKTAIVVDLAVRVRHKRR